jgi:uncharacterized membrane protein
MLMSRTTLTTPDSKPAAGAGFSKVAPRGDRVLLLLIAMCGLGFAVVLPPFQVSDEHGHFIRAYEIASGHFLGSPAPALPSDVAAMVLRYPELLELKWTIPASDILADLRGAIDIGVAPAILSPDADHKYLSWGILGSNVYCPLAYFPASIGILAGSVMRLPPLALLYAGRLGNVLFFVAIIAVVFRLAPEYRALFAALALLPMTLHQAGGLSADIVAIAFSLLGAAALLWLRDHQATPKTLALIALVFVLWVVCKTSPWAFAAVFLIPTRCFARRRSWILYVLVVGLAMVGVTLLWQAIAHGNVEAFRAARLSNGIDMGANSRLLLAHPFEFLRVAAAFAFKHLGMYQREFIGAFGWSRFALPFWFRWGYVLLLLVVAFTERALRPFSALDRSISIAVLLMGVIFIHAILFVTDGSVCSGPGGSTSLCFNASAGIQGRYFIPIAIFGLLALRQRRFTLPQERLFALVAVVGVVEMLTSMYLIWSRYYWNSEHLVRHLV